MKNYVNQTWLKNDNHYYHFKTLLVTNELHTTLNQDKNFQFLSKLEILSFCVQFIFIGILDTVSPLILPFSKLENQ